MKTSDFIRSVPAILACVGMLVPVTQVSGQTPSAPTRAEPIDVSLQENGLLFGLVVDAQGKPAAGTGLRLRQANREIVRFAADAQGRFAVTGLRGGTYEIATPKSAGLYRFWAANTAPPSARPGVLIVEGGPQVRGQQTMRDFLSKPWVLTAVVAAAIAVPIAVASQHGSSHTPASK